MSKIILIRHVHRDKIASDHDNGISEKGREQVEKLVQSYKDGLLPKSTIFWTSPKKRCIETLGPLSKAAGAKLFIDNALDEHDGSEGVGGLQKRLIALISRLNESKENVYLCSHGDILPELAFELTGKHVNFSKGQAIVVEKAPSGDSPGSPSSKNTKWELL